MHLSDEIRFFIWAAAFGVAIVALIINNEF